MNTQNLFLIIGSFFLISFIQPCFAQEGNIPKEGTSEDVFVVVEKMPEFKGGNEALLKFLQENLTYPTEARKEGFSGTVYITFIVDTDGNIINEKVIRGADKFLNEEAIRVIKLTSGKWTPGVQRGKNVKVAYTLPIKFALTEPKNEEDDTK